jgi:hypothetical protein
MKDVKHSKTLSALPMLMANASSQTARGLAIDVTRIEPARGVSAIDDSRIKRAHGRQQDR